MKYSTTLPTSKLLLPPLLWICVYTAILSCKRFLHWSGEVAICVVSVVGPDSMDIRCRHANCADTLMSDGRMGACTCINTSILTVAQWHLRPANGPVSTTMGILSRRYVVRTGAIVLWGIYRWNWNTGQSGVYSILHSINGIGLCC